MLEQNIEKFNQIITRLTKANLLIIDKEIALFLSELVDNDVFRNIITQSNKNYSFDEDFQKFLDQKQITLPHNKNSKIAFTLGLLYKLDIKELSSIDMLKIFYNKDNSDLQTSYTQFCNEILLPFQEAFISLMKGEPVNQDEEQIPSPAPVLDKMNEDIDEWLNLLMERINQNTHKLDEYAEKELDFMIKGFSNNLDGNNNNLTKLLWIGLKNTLYKYNMGYKEIDEIEKLFTIYGLNMEI